MKKLFATIFFVILSVNFSKAQSPNVTNASVPTNSSSNATTPLTTLYIGAFFDLGTRDGYGSLPMAQQAIEEINNNTDILPGYRLELVINSTQGSFGFGQKVFHEFLTKGPRKIMLLGPGQDSLAKSVAAYSGIPDVNLLQFSYGTSDLELANRRDLYPNFFRTTTSLASLDAPRIKFIQEYGWNEVGIIYGDSVHYLKLSNQLADRLKQNNIKVLAEVRLQANDPKRAIRTLKDKGIHVILGMFSLDAVAQKMICEAYRQKMYGPHYVWMLINSISNNWWIPGQNQESACSDLEMKCQIQNHFSFYHTRVISNRGRFYQYANKTGAQIVDEYRAKVDNESDTSNRSNIFLNVYDAVWSIAFVLHESRGEILKQGKSLENLTYGDVNATAVFKKQAEKLDFPTPSIGTRVRYYPNGDRKTAIILKQIVIQDGKFKMVGAGGFDVDTNGFTASSEIHWFAGTPYTKTAETYTYRTIDWTLFIFLAVFASLGIVYALFCFLVLILNFKNKIVQNSGPIISVVIIIGCILNYVTVILYGFDYSLVSPDTVTSLCRARSWTFAIGFTLSIGGLAAKLWIAYCVLKDRFVRSRNVMMFWMLGILVLLFIIDIIILACWEGKDPLYRTLKQVRSQPEYKCFEPITADTFRAEIEVVEHCVCADLTLWLIVILLFKVSILLAGGFLAWQTRRVYIPSLNDTQHCVSCMFIVLLFCIIGIIVAFTTTMYPSAYYGVIGALIVIATTIILVLLFTNKIVRLSCRRKRTKTLRVGEASPSNNKYACACGAVCAKFCSCCACSAACCISCCSCFPCCNLYSCLRSFLFGSQVHPTASGGVESKAEYYIGGIAQDRDAEIVYLKNELREKNTQLNNLGQKHTVKSNWTQTMDDESFIWDHDDADSMFSDGTDVSDVESAHGSESNQRFRRAAKKVRIFSEAVDYSHIRSKVNTGMQRSSLSPGSSKPRRGSRMQVFSPSDEDLKKLKTTLAQKDDEIQRLRLELEGHKKPELAVKAQQSSTLGQQEMAKTSPNMQNIVLIETPATPIPPEDPDDVTTTIVLLPVTSIPSKSDVNVNESTSEKSDEVKTQDRSKKKSSLGAAGSWLLNDQSESTKDDKNPEKTAIRKDSKTKDDKNAEANAPRKISKDNSKTRKDDTNPETNTPRKVSKDSSTTAFKAEDKTSKMTSLESVPGPVSHDKTETFGDDNTTPSTQNSTEAGRKTSLMHVAMLVHQETGSPAKTADKEGDEASKETDNINGGKQQGQASIPDENQDLEHGTKQAGEDDESNKENKEANSENSKDENGNKKEETRVKKKSVHRKISSWLFGGDDDKEDADKKDAKKDNYEKKMDDKDNKENEAENTNQGDKGGAKESEDMKSNSLINGTNKEKNQTDEDRGSMPVDRDTIGGESGINDNGLDPNNRNANNEPSKDENITNDVKKQEDDAIEDGDGRNMEMIDEEGEDDGDDEDDDDDDDDDDEGEAQDENNVNGGGAATDAKGRRGSKNGRRRRKKIGFGKLKWNAQSKVDTGTSSYKPKTTVRKIPHFKNDYSHVKSRVSTLSEANVNPENAVENQSSEKRRRSISFSKAPNYSNVRPRLYNGTTRRYNSEMPNTVTK